MFLCLKLCGVCGGGRGRTCGKRTQPSIAVLLLLIIIGILSVEAVAGRGIGRRGLSKESTKLRKKSLITLHQWTRLELLNVRSDAIAAEEDTSWLGPFDSDKLLLVDADVEYGDDGNHRTFLTIPRLGSGVPYSLAVVASMDNAMILNPRLEPYPNAAWHVNPESMNCEGVIVSAMRTFIDECWRLWIIDSGQVNSVQMCAPQILAFDLVTDRLVDQFTLPAHLYRPGVSVFTALAVDVSMGDDSNDNGDNDDPACRDTMVYVADPWGYGLIVYDVLAKRSWRIEHKLMRPDVSLQTVNAASDGIFTVSLSPKRSGTKRKEIGERQLYFHALNSYKEVTVPLELVNNGSLWLNGHQNGAAAAAMPSKPSRSARNAFKVLGNRGTQCESEVMDSSGNLYCSLIASHALTTWSEGNGRRYNSDTLKVVSYNPEQLKFVTGLKINRNAAGEDELWALSSEPSLFVGGKIGTETVKFRLIGCRTKNLIGNVPCTVEAQRNV